MPEMGRLRKEDLSLYYYIKDIVLYPFMEMEEFIALSYMATASDPDDQFDPYYVYEALTEMIPDPTERGRGWVYFDDILDANGTCLQHYILVSGTNAHGDQCLGTPEQSNRITVYDSTVSGVISDQNYMVDYIDGRIITSGTTTPAYVSYYWNYVSVVDEWAAIEAADPPVVVIDIRGTDKGGYQFGGGKKNTRKVDLHIFATNTAERNDIVEALYDGLYLKGCPLYELSTGSVLDYDGTFYGRRYGMNKLTSLFCRRIISDSSRLQFENVVARHVNLPLLMTRSRDEVMLSDLNAYRSKISFDMISYTGGANDTNDPYNGYGGT